jgi:hypothetical protein
MTRLWGSLIENYQTKAGRHALIWRKNGYEYVLQRGEGIWNEPP